ncbi:MAG: T9SS type A sorting domain-containing protein [Candidatus Eiseniibacteriota bacterium]
MTPLARFLSLVAAVMAVMAVAGGAALFTVRPLVAPRDARSESATSPHTSQTHAGHAMTEEKMDAWVRDWFTHHPRVGGGPATLGAAYADTFFAAGFDFNADTNPSDVDTVTITVGDSILWRRSNGSHTVTSGTGSSDPQVGLLFDRDLNSFSTTFAYVFDKEGTFPFFCRPHEPDNMRGVVIVEAPTGVGVEPIAGEPGAIGFLGPPVPNPARSVVTVRFALATTGHARLKVVDATGRRVAVLLDEPLEAGAYVARWDRKSESGGRAAAGVYFLALEIPGKSAREKLVIAD